MIRIHDRVFLGSGNMVMDENLYVRCTQKHKSSVSILCQNFGINESELIRRLIFHAWISFTEDGYPELGEIPEE